MKESYKDTLEGEKGEMVKKDALWRKRGPPVSRGGRDENRIKRLGTEGLISPSCPWSSSVLKYL